MQQRMLQQMLTHTTAQKVMVLLELILLWNSSYSITTTQNSKVLGAVVFQKNLYIVGVPIEPLHSEH